ncbi:MAG: hypothetical protein GTO02_07825 [Candidatus Dadabacteria bacterium]|nr:hypothetical protein [Candidatus Dadabacteria bacterium]
MTQHKFFINQLNCVCSFEQTNILKLSTRIDTMEKQNTKDRIKSEEEKQKPLSDYNKRLNEFNHRYGKLTKAEKLKEDSILSWDIEEYEKLSKEELKKELKDKLKRLDYSYMIYDEKLNHYKNCERIQFYRLTELIKYLTKKIEGLK